MRLIQLFKIALFLTFAFSLPIKPSNSKNLEIVKISDKNKTRTYYHLDKKNSLVYPRLNKIFDKDKNYAVKIISRTKISKNSNSSKSFGYVLNIIEGKDTTIKELKFKKKVSKSKVPNKRGFSYTNAGFWLEEFKGNSKIKLLIEPLKGSPEIDLRVVFNEIKDDKFINDINPVNVLESNTVYFLKDSSYIKSNKWFSINKKNEFQFKVNGPLVLKIISRTDNLFSDDEFYGFKVFENGKFMINQNHKIVKSKKNAYYLDKNENKMDLTKFNATYLNVPEGLNYYLIKNIQGSNGNTLVKVESTLND